MEVELLEIREHMARFAPFDGLSDDLLDELAVVLYKDGELFHQRGERLDVARLLAAHAHRGRGALEDVEMLRRAGQARHDVRALRVLTAAS